MRKRLYKKKVKQMSDHELSELLAHRKSQSRRRIINKEFTKRFNAEYDAGCISQNEFFLYYAEKYILNQ